jgi:hypothetical protein
MLAHFSALYKLVGNQSILEINEKAIKIALIDIFSQFYLFHAILFNHHWMRKKKEWNFNEAWNVPINHNISHPSRNCFVQKSTFRFASCITYQQSTSRSTANLTKNIAYNFSRLANLKSILT